MTTTSASQRLTIRLTAAELSALHESAAAAGVTASVRVRAALLRDLGLAADPTRRAGRRPKNGQLAAGCSTDENHAHKPARTRRKPRK